MTAPSLQPPDGVCPGCGAEGQLYPLHGWHYVRAEQLFGFLALHERGEVCADCRDLVHHERDD